MRIRTLKPEWTEDERLTMCSLAARVLSVNLILWSDDYGNGRLGPERVMAAKSFPACDDCLELFRAAVVELAGWFILLYSESGQEYYHVINWDRHQKVDNPGKPHVPSPSEESISSARAGRGPGLGRGPGPGLGQPRESREDDARVSLESREGLASVCRPSSDLTPYWPDIAEAIRAAWDMTEPLPMPQGSSLIRLKAAYQMGEAKSPGHGIVRVCEAVRGHRVAQCLQGAQRRNDDPQWAWPPVVEGKEVHWAELDRAKFSLLAEAGCARAKKKRDPNEYFSDGRKRVPGV